jgi:sugar phosphate permease
LSASPTSSPAAERQVFAKIGWRLMPMLTTAYVLNYLDRTNVGFAALTMNQALGLTATQFGSARGCSSFSATASSKCRATSRSTASARAAGCRAS